MLKYKEFVESITEISHSNERLLFALDGYFPFTDKVAKAYYNTRINTFHITDIKGLKGIKPLIGSKKVLSTFTMIDKYFIEEFRGIQTEGGVLLQLNGNLVLNSVTDIISVVDEYGLRWIAEFNFREYSDNFGKQFKRFKAEVDKKAAEFDAFKTRNPKFLEWYMPFVEDFLIKNKEEIVDFLTRTPDYYWDEVLVNDIVVKDVLFLASFKDYSFIPFTKSVIKSEFGSLENLEKYINSIATGEVYITRDKKEALNFVVSRGGEAV